MEILFLSRWFPYPPDNGSKIRVYNLLRQLAERHTVDLISFWDGEVSEARMTQVRSFCRNVDTVPYRAFQPRRAQALAGFF